MSIKVMSKVWESAESSGGELLVLLAIADFCNDKGFAWPSIDTLSKKSRLSERQTQRAIRSLKKKGYLHIGMNDGPHGVNLYSVHLEGGDNITPATPVVEGGDMDGPKGVTPMTPKPSLTVKEPSLGKNPLDWSVLCPAFKDQELYGLWERWMKHRRGCKKPGTDWTEFFAGQAEWLRGYSPDQIKAILTKSLIGGYQGLFEPQQSQTKPSYSDRSEQKNLDLLIRTIERTTK